MEEIELSKIRIPKWFKEPNLYKLEERRNYYKENKQFKVPIIVTKKFLLLDGYTSYIVAKENNFKEVSIIYYKKRKRKNTNE